MAANKKDSGSGSQYRAWHKPGFPTEKKSSGRSLKNLNLAREQHNKMFTVVRVCDKKIKDFFIKTQQII